MIEFAVPGEAVAFARAGAQGKRRFTPNKQKKAMDDIAIFAKIIMGGKPPIARAVSMKIEACYVAPRSWSAKERGLTHWKTSKPDADNIAKLIKDAIKMICITDDAIVAVLNVEKFYGPEAYTFIRIEELS